MSVLSANDIVKMQNEAVFRVNEMRQKTKAAVSIMNGDLPIQQGDNDELTDNIYTQKQREAPVKINGYHISMPVEYPQKEQQPVEIQPTKSEESINDSAENKKSAQKENNLFPSVLTNIFKNINTADSEKLFLLSLCFLLYSDGCDEGIIMALMYILA